ncbi:MAG: hypothetical protein R3D68_17450 [Hyphomicrobiaceae bacterium]
MSGQITGSDERVVTSYRGHRIATLRVRDSWAAILDDKMTFEVAFDSADEAAAWLRRRVDARIAEAMFPGLASA